MASTIGFDRVKTYLSAIAEQNGALASSPHQAFWQVDYDTFVNGNVPNVLCHGAPIPIVNHANPIESPFFHIMVDTAGFCGKRQMPPGGPNISKDDEQIVLDDGTTVTGKQVREDLATWLTNGFPKDPTPIPPAPAGSAPVQKA